jgi:hypothetical protein
MEQRNEQQACSGMRNAPEKPAARGRSFMKGQSGNPRGRRLMAERAAEDECYRLEEVTRITADLGAIGCVPTRQQELLIDELAGLAIRSRRLRKQGKPTDNIAMLMTRIIGRLDRRPGADTSARDELGAYLAEAHAEPADAPSEPEGA